MVKRKAPSSVSPARKVKKVCKKVVINNECVSASATRNFLLKNTLVDWLELFGDSKGFKPDLKIDRYGSKNIVGSINNHPRRKRKTVDRLNFFLMDRGFEFEKLVMDELKLKFPNTSNGEPIIVDVSEKIPDESETTENVFQNRYDYTMKLIQEGVPIIYQGFVYNSKTKTYGYPDLIVRSDYFEKIVSNSPISDEKKKHRCDFSKKYHYRIIDIKFTTLKLKVNCKNLLAGGSINAYKGQLYIYNAALGEMQGYTPATAYLLGRAWKSAHENGDKYDRLACVSFDDVDNDVIEEVEEACNWIRRLRNEGDTWKLDPPTIIELYPNMCINNDNWSGVKNKLANDLKDITSIWQCGIRHREYAFDKEIYEWTDERCNATNLGMNLGKIHSTVDRILNINRSKETDVNKLILYNKNAEEIDMRWRYEADCLNLFADFEGVSSIMDLEGDSSMIYLFGIGNFTNTTDVASMDSADYTSPTSNFTWQHYSFIVDRLTVEEEKKKAEDFFSFIKSKSNGKKVKIYHYSQAEPAGIRKLIARHGEFKDNTLIEWIDLYKLITHYSIVMKGCLDFSLKSIVDALYQLQVFDVSYRDLEVKSGSMAMIAAINSDAEAENKKCKLIEIPKMKDVVKYNNNDCKVLPLLVDMLSELIKKEEEKEMVVMKD
jgi:hypothetical protein